MAKYYFSEGIEFIIGVCYHPPKPLYKCNDLIQLVTADVDYISSHNPTAILLFGGDLNMLNTDFLTVDSGLTQLNDDATHGKRILDKIFVNRPHLYECLTVNSSVQTKHKAVILKPAGRSLPASFGSAGQKKIYRCCFDIRDPHITALKQGLASYKWSVLLQETDVNKLYTDLISVLRWFINNCIPVKRVAISNNAPKFITPLIQILLKRRNKLMHAGKFEKASELSIKIGRLISNETAASLSKVNSSNTRELWNKVNSIRTSRGHVNLSTYGPPFDDLEALNKYFADVGTDNNYDKEAVINFIQPTEKEAIIPFDLYTVSNALKRVKKTAQGSDPLPYWIFKHCFVELAPVIHHLYNLILATGISPNSWKHANVTPIVKVTPPKSFGDIRPISVTPILSRVFERLFVSKHLFNVIPQQLLQDQFAFRPTGSTTAALVYMDYHITRMLENADFVRCFLIDFQKAFDTVSHSVLLQTIKNFDAPQYVINWLANFLTDRTQCLVTSQGCQKRLNITRSVVQGSGFGPTGFISLMANLQPFHPTTVYSKYADDLTVLISGVHSHNADTEINHIQDWADTHKLKINVKKTKEVIISRSNRISHKPLPINNIEQLTDVKLLGVKFNNHLSYHLHVEDILRSVNQRFYLMKILKCRGLNDRGLMQIFNSLVLSKLTYANQAFSGHLREADIDRLQCCLDKAFKWGFSPVHHNIRLLFQLADHSLFKSFSKNPNHCLHYLLKSKQRLHNSTLRQRGHNFELPKTKFCHFKNSYINRCLYTYI